MKQSGHTIKVLMIIIIAIVVVAIAVFMIIKPYYIRSHLPKAVVINTSQQPTLGNRGAKIHFVVFEDLKCMNCARFSNQIFPMIKKEYIDTGIAKYTMINVAFVPGSLPAANAAHCIYAQNPALFFDYVEHIYKNQPPENENWATVPKLMLFAKNLKGLNTDQFAQCLIQSPYDQVIQNNLNEAIKVMGSQVATPSLYINGIKVDPVTKARVKEIIQAVK